MEIHRENTGRKLTEEVNKATHMTKTLESRIKQRIEKNRETSEMVRSKLDKLIFSIENSPDKKMRKIYYDHCIFPIVNDCELLEEFTAKLETHLTHRELYLD
jgi:hypothetical protein